jgi:choline dehydrogenase-like flavoprotein
VLTDRERLTLRAVVDTFVPALDPAGEEGHAALFARSGGDLGVPERIEEAIGALDEDSRAEFRLLLRLLDGRILPAILGGGPRPFSTLSAAERAHVVLAMSRSPVARLRTGFQGLKRLSTFLFYTVMPGGAPNPVWRGIGYRAPPRFPAAEAEVRLTPPAELPPECDVCVVGSGAGGAVAAWRLAAAGHRVVVLEAGGGAQAPDFAQTEMEGTRDLYLERGLASTTDLGIGVLAGWGLGGGTTINWQTSLRTPDDVRDEWAERSGCGFFRDDAFTAALDAVCERLHVGVAESRLNPNNDVLKRGCDALGYAWELIPRNALGCDLAQCGYCAFGCRHGGKQSTPRTYLVDAQRDGALVVAGCRVDRLRIENGRVTGLEATMLDPASGSPRSVTLRARTVIVAAGAIMSPVLLLRSGLRNRHIGRHLLLHPTTAVGGEFPEPVRMWEGAPQTVVCTEFAHLSGNYGFRLETVPAHPGMMALALPWRGAREHRRLMQPFDRLASTIVLARDRLGGRVTASRSGRPVIRYRPGLAEREFLRRGVAAAVRVQAAAGAVRVETLHTPGEALMLPEGAGRNRVDDFCGEIARMAVDRNRSGLFTAHQMGTCRMGSDLESSVCAPDGQVHGVRGLYVADASLFPGSSGVNPMITVMALAHHVGGQIPRE